MRVLICEDNTLIALDLEDQVRECGHTPVGIACRSTDCLDMASASRPDVVLLDINLADGRTGPMVAEEMCRRGIRYVIMSGELSFLPPEVQADDLLEKPVSQLDLCRALVNVSDR